jgi:GSH-dependent disulfide-bond oxidoreductase
MIFFATTTSTLLLFNSVVAAHVLLGPDYTKRFSSWNTVHPSIPPSRLLAKMSSNSNDNHDEDDTTESPPQKKLKETPATTTTTYTPAKVWNYQGTSGSQMSMNRPDSGARFDRELPIGKHPIQLYSLATPNGQKVTIMLEELIEAGVVASAAAPNGNVLEYDAWYIDIMTKTDQFGSDFVQINPNSKIPAMCVYEKDDTNKDKEPLRLFESASIVLYLAEKFHKFLPTNDDNPQKRLSTMNWVFWLHGSAPYLGGGFGHFYTYATVKQEYPIERFTMETKRQLDVLEKNLIGKAYMIGDDYTIADITIWPWYGNLVLGRLYGDAATFLNVEQEYPNLLRWAKDMDSRPGVKRGRLVNRNDGLLNRHAASDFDTIEWQNFKG